MKTRSRILALVLSLALCFSLAGAACASGLSKFADLVSGEQPTYSTTIAFLSALDENGIPYEFEGKNENDKEEVLLDYPGDYCEDIFINIFFGPDEDDVYFRIWNLIDFNSSDYRELLGKINGLNDNYNFACFVLDESDYSVTVKLDALLGANPGDMTLDYMLMLGQIADAGYHALEAYVK